MFATPKDEFRFLIIHHPTLSPGQKEQCLRFLKYYKDGIGICQRYLAIGTGEVVVKTTGKPPFWHRVRFLLLEKPGLTGEQLRIELGCTNAAINNCLGKGLRNGRFVKLGKKIYAN